MIQSNSIKDLREQTYLSQSRFAAILGIPVSNIAKWEQGVATPPEYVRKLIEYRLIQIGLIKR